MTRVPATQYETTPVYPTYVDLKNDVKPYLQLSSETIKNEPELQLIMEMACYWVQNYLGRPVGEMEFKRRFSGWSGNTGAYLALPYYPVLEVKEVVEYWGISGPHVLEEQTPENQGGSEVFQIDPLRGLLVRTFMGLVQRPWFPGSLNVIVVWTAGYNPIPPDLRLATLQLIRHWWQNTEGAVRTSVLPGSDFETEGNVQGMWTGVPSECVELLRPYVQVGIA